MDVKLMVQSTPNPNALKFVVNTPVKTEGNYTYKSAAECDENPLAKAIFDINASIHEVYFFDNYITVTQDGAADWDNIEEGIRSIILSTIASHDPNFQTPQVEKATPATLVTSPELEKINGILDETVRPALQADGGDMQVVSYENKHLKVLYQGACGSCPSATMGTLVAIENILKDQFDPEITVSLADTFE